MILEIKSLEEMPRGLSLLIEKVDSLQKTVNTLRHKLQANDSPRWMNIDELCGILLGITTSTLLKLENISGSE